jgi:hypothetical protein
MGWLPISVSRTVLWVAFVVFVATGTLIAYVVAAPRGELPRLTRSFIWATIEANQRV